MINFPVRCIYCTGQRLWCQMDLRFPPDSSRFIPSWKELAGSNPICLKAGVGSLQRITTVILCLPRTEAWTVKSITMQGKLSLRLLKRDLRWLPDRVRSTLFDSVETGEKVIVQAGSFSLLLPAAVPVSMLIFCCPVHVPGDFFLWSLPFCPAADATWYLDLPIWHARTPRRA